MACTHARRPGVDGAPHPFRSTWCRSLEGTTVMSVSAGPVMLVTHSLSQSRSALAAYHVTPHRCPVRPVTSLSAAFTYLLTNLLLRLCCTQAGNTPLG